MIEQEMEQMDIAQHHALFEREMTEVILKLRGEFASISGTDMGYEAYGVSAEKLKIPVVSIPNAEITKTVISVPEAQQMACGQIWPAKAEQQEISIPPIPKFHRTPPDFCVDKTGAFSISLPHIKPAVMAAIPSIAPKKICMSNLPKEQTAPVWQVGLPSVPAACIKVTVPAAAQSALSREITLEPIQVAVAAPPMEKPVLPRKITVGPVRIPITMPGPASAQIPTRITATPVSARISIPQVKKIPVEMSVAKKPASSGQWKNAVHSIGQIPGAETWNRAAEQIGRTETVVRSREKAPEYWKPMITIPSFSSLEILDLPRIAVTVCKIPSFSPQGEIRTAAICRPADIPIPKKLEIDTQIQEILTTFQI